MRPAVQELIDQIERLVSRSADRPCDDWTPGADPHERFRGTVCATCHFPEPFHIMAKAAVLLQDDEIGAWDPARAAFVAVAVGQVLELVRQKADHGLISVAIDVLKSFALEPRPPVPQEQVAASMVRAVLDASRKARVEDRELVQALQNARTWLDSVDQSTAKEVSAEIETPEIEAPKE